jgi:hypothetical protein
VRGYFKTRTIGRRLPVLRNPRHERFAQALAQGKTADAGYKNAGYKPNRHNACRLKTNEHIKARILELQQETHKAVVQHFVITKQYLVDALIENIEVSLGRRPVKISAGGVPTYTYRAEAANAGIKMAGREVGMFRDRSEVRVKMDFDDLTDEELLIRLRDEADALLLENQARNNGDSEG